MTDLITEHADELRDWLVELADSLADEIDLDRILGLVVAAAQRLTGARYAALGVLAEDGGSLVRFIHRGVDDETAREIGHLPTGGGLLGELIRHPEPIIVDDLSSHPSFQGFPSHHPKMTSFLGAPIRAGGRVFGNFYLTDKPGGFTQADLRGIIILAAQAGAAIHSVELSRRLRGMAVQDERDRISRDLHDGVIQSLFSVGMGLEGAKALIGRDDSRLRERIESAVDQLDETIREIRNTIFTLRPGRADHGLQAGLLELAKEYEVNEIMRPTTNVSQSLDLTVSESLVPDVLHIVREALSNVAKHAQARQVHLEAEVQEGATLVIEVRDLGVGFDPDAAELGNGLGNMAERAVLLGGDLIIDSTPGQGTSVVLTVPLATNDLFHD